MKLEREVKLAAWGGFAIPPLDDVAPGITVEGLKAKKLDATYYDTRDLRLARAGVSLRHRLGDDEVSVYHGRRLASRFREVEVEVEEEAPDGLLEAIVERLRSVGAGAPD